METLRVLSSPSAVSVSATAATLLTPSDWSGGTALIHNPVSGSRVALTIIAEHASTPSNVDAANQLYTLVGGDSLSLNLGPGLAVFGKADASGVTLNVAVGGP